MCDPDEARQRATISLERICAAGWPGTQQELRGEWLLRAGSGFTGRANSALVLGEPDLEPDAAIDHAVHWYLTRGLAPKFQLPTGSVSAAITDVDLALAARGFQVVDEVAVLTAAVGTVRQRLPAAAGGSGVQLRSRPDQQWLQMYEYRGKPLPPNAIQVLLAGPEPFFLTLVRRAEPVAVTRGIVTDGWLGITAATVPVAYRRQGFATAALAGALAAGVDRGAEHVYLQVSRDNVAALALYARLGFTEHHGYHCRVR